MKITLSATVVQRGKVVATATNIGDSENGYIHGKRCGYERSVHAELRVARLARGKLARNIPWGVLVTRYRKDGGRAVSKPCKLCVAYLSGAGCSWIDYFDNNGCVQRIRM